MQILKIEMNKKEKMITIKIFIIIYLIVDLVNLILHRKLGNFLKNNTATRSILEKKYNGRKELVDKMIDSMDEIAWCEYLRSLIPIYHVYELLMLSSSLLALKLIPEETMKEVVKKAENDDTW